jgi:hypothetical protein
VDPENSASPFFGADWSLVAVETCLVALVLLAAVVVAFRGSAHAWLRWSLCALGLAAVVGSGFMLARLTDCADSRALGGTVLRGATTGIVVVGGACAPALANVRWSMLLPVVVVMSCVAVLIGKALTHSGQRPGWAPLTAAVAAVAVGAGTLVLVNAPPSDDNYPVTVLVASQRIPSGTSVQDAVDSGELVLRKTSAVNVQEGAIGNVKAIQRRTFVRTVYPGETITVHMFPAP